MVDNLAHRANGSRDASGRLRAQDIAWRWRLNSETVLLPFKDRIVYDGLLSGYNISFGGGIKRMLNDSYRRAKERQGIVTSLPIEAIPTTAANPRAVGQVADVTTASKPQPHGVDPLSVDVPIALVTHARVESVTQVPGSFEAFK